MAGLREMFKMIDADNGGQVPLEELEIGLEKLVGVPVFRNLRPSG